MYYFCSSETFVNREFQNFAFFTKIFEKALDKPHYKVYYTNITLAHKSFKALKI